MQRSTLSSLLFLALLLGLLGSLSACGQAATDDSATESPATPDTDDKAQEPAQFRDGFEDGDTSGWDIDKDADDAGESMPGDAGATEREPAAKTPDDG